MSSAETAIDRSRAAPARKCRSPLTDRWARRARAALPDPVSCVVMFHRRKCRGAQTMICRRSNSPLVVASLYTSRSMTFQERASVRFAPRANRGVIYHPEGRLSSAFQLRFRGFALPKWRPGDRRRHPARRAVVGRAHRRARRSCRREPRRRTVLETVCFCARPRSDNTESSATSTSGCVARPSRADPPACRLWCGRPSTAPTPKRPAMLAQDGRGSRCSHVGQVAFTGPIR
jgi:hypothetical protein